MRAEFGEMSPSPSVTMHDRLIVRSLNQHILALIDRCTNMILSVHPQQDDATNSSLAAQQPPLIPHTTTRRWRRVHDSPA